MCGVNVLVVGGGDKSSDMRCWKSGFFGGKLKYDMNLTIGPMIKSEK